MTFDEAFTALLGNEGGYVNNPADPGGETNWGVTIAVARSQGYTGPMVDMTQDQAKAIYKPLYWDRIHGDELPAALTFQAFDAAVNHGVSEASKLLQIAAKTFPDGQIGPATLAAIAAADPIALSIRFIAARLRFITSLSTFTTFGKGWTNREAANLERLAS